MSYYSVYESGASQYEDRKSIFIGRCEHVKSEEEALRVLEDERKKYADAKHHVYAYVVRENQVVRFSDDHEPQGTAGRPILDILKKKNFEDLIVVVTRYFGGTLLGTGGLVKAYTEAAKNAVENAGIAMSEIYALYEGKIRYADFELLKKVFETNGASILSTEYAEDITIKFFIKKEQWDSFIRASDDQFMGKYSWQFLSEEERLAKVE